MAGQGRRSSRSIRHPCFGTHAPADHRQNRHSLLSAFYGAFSHGSKSGRSAVGRSLLYWQGLGYYTRARSLHATAGIIVSQYGGKFPQTRQEVLKLKGIGSYTVASFLALAFNQPETVVDGNVIRIICRLYNLTEPVDEIAGLIRQKAEALTDRTCPADYASAIMDLGAGICTPKNPQCLLCPWQNFCRARGLENLENIPRRKKAAKKKNRLRLSYS